MFNLPPCLRWWSRSRPPMSAHIELGHSCRRKNERTYFRREKCAHLFPSRRFCTDTNFRRPDRSFRATVRRRRGGRPARGNRGSDLVQPSFVQRSQSFLPTPRFPVARTEAFDAIATPLLRLVLSQPADSILCAHARFGLHFLDFAHEFIV